MRGLAAVTIAAALLVPAPAAAQGPATIRGVVYDCSSGGPIDGAAVQLRNLDSGSTTHLLVRGDGRFVRVGLEPGRYLISATGPVVRGKPGLTLPSHTASRLARVENDDVLDMRIGTYRTLYYTSQRRARASENMPSPPAPPNTAQPICDPPYVPPAPSTASRYIIH
jgi:hypothetical protein